jgi:hypothetical protein
MTPLQERYVHFVERIQNLNSAWRIPGEVTAVQPGAIRAAIYRMALIE